MTFTVSRELLGLEDQVVIVNGAARGIGRAIAVKFAEAGAHTVIADIDEAGGEESRRRVQQVGRTAVYVHADLTTRSGNQSVVDTALAEFGSFLAVVNVTGGVSRAVKPFLDYTLDDWDSAQQLNQHTTLLATQVGALAMIKHGIHGRIVNVGSTSGVTGAPNISSYGSANAGVIHFTKSASMELAQYGIRVNCLIPGTHWTEQMLATYQDPNTPEPRRLFLERANNAPPLGRLGQPEETAGVAVFLASNLSGYMTGQSVISDGGVTNTTARPAVGGNIVPESVREFADAGSGVDAGGHS